MHIIHATYDQTDPRFGQRAGSQCMSNCFVYLHTAFVSSIATTLNTETLDIILNYGAKLDTLTQVMLGDPRETYRLGTEIPTTITTPFGTTGHLLSRPFNGTAETQDLDGYRCLGIFDFLQYAMKKTQPTYIILTVGVCTRALITTPKKTFIFDPHSTDMSEQAAVYLCESIDEIVTTLSSFGTLIGDFYYDAVFVYFIDMTSRSLTSEELSITVLNTYRDLDLDIEIPLDPLFPPRSSRKRTAPKEQVTQKSKHLKTDIDLNGTLSLLNEYTRTVHSFKKQADAYLVPSSYTWILYSGSESFEKDFLTERIYHLLSQNIDSLLATKQIKKIDDVNRFVPENVDAQHREHIVLSYFEPFIGFSTETDDLIKKIKDCNLDIIVLYNKYVKHQKSVSHGERILATKLLTIFRHYCTQHAEATEKWTEKLISNIPLKNHKSVKTYLDTYLKTQHIPTDSSFICLDKVYKKSVCKKISDLQQTLIQLYTKNEARYHELQNYISNIGSVTNLKDNGLNTITTDALEPEHLISLKSSASIKLQDIYTNSKHRLAELLKSHENRIITGFLPLDEATDMLKYLSSILVEINVLQKLQLTNDVYINDIKTIYDKLHFLIHGQNKFFSSTDDHITTLRNEYLRSEKHMKDKQQQILDLIDNIEDMIVDTNDLSDTTIEMIKTQIQDIETMDLDETSEMRLQRLLHKLKDSGIESTRFYYEFVSNLTLSNLSSISGIKLPDLKSELEQNLSLRETFNAKIIILINDVLKNIQLKNMPSQDTLNKLSLIIEQLPIDMEHTQKIREGFTLLTSLVHQTKASSKRSIQDLETLIDFFTSNSRIFEDLSGVLDTKILSDIYKSSKVEFENKIQFEKETSWEKHIRTIEIDSPGTLYDIVRTAPTQHSIDKILPELQLKLKTKMERDLQKKNEEIQKSKKDAIQKIIQDLHIVATSFSSQVPSTFKTVNLKSIEALLVQLETPTDVISGFNNELANNLNILINKLEKIELETLEKLLTAKQPTDDNFSTNQTLRHNIHVVLQSPLLLYPETTSRLTMALEYLQFFESSIRLKEPEHILRESRHKQAFELYTKLCSEIDSLVNEAHKKLDLEYLQTEQSIDRTESKITDQKPFIIQLKTPFDTSLKTRILDINIPFKKRLEDILSEKETVLQTHVELINAKTKTKIDRHNAIKASDEARWKETVIKYRLSLPEGIDVSTDRLLKDPINIINKLIDDCQTRLPYITSNRVLEWIIVFISETCIFVDDAQSYGTLAEKTRRCLDEIAKYIHYDRLCEDMILHPNREPPKDIDIIITYLDPKRIAGGEIRYKTIAEHIQFKRDTVSRVEQIERLSNEYFNLLDDVQHFRYGLDFSSQFIKIQKLKDLFKLIKDNRPATHFPRLDEPTDEIPISSFLRGLSAIERYLTSGQGFIDNLMSKQSLINTPPIFYHSVNDTDIHKSTDHQSDAFNRLTFTDNTDIYFKCLNVFNEQDIVDGKGISVMFSQTYHNLLFKFFFLQRDNMSTIQESSQYRLVSTKYKTATVNAAIAVALKSFWTEVLNYDLKDILVSSLNNSVSSPRNAIINLKVFVYLLTLAWSTQEDGERASITLQLNDFCTLLAALYPEYVYGVTQIPIHCALNTLYASLNKQAVFEAFNVTTNPPIRTITEMKAFCIEIKTWSPTDVASVMWNHDLIQQICYKKSRNVEWSRTAGKLFQYLLAFHILPKEVLQCTWTQFKPRFADHFNTFQEFVRSLIIKFFDRNDIRYETPTRDSEQFLETGEKIIQKIIVIKKQSNDDLLETFSQTPTVLDYIIGSYVFDVPATFCIYIGKLFSNTRYLLTRHVENTPDDTDFSRIVASRDLSFTDILDTSHTDQLIEHSWFAAQAETLRNHLVTEKRLDHIPLIIYDHVTNYVTQCLREPAHDDSSKTITFDIVNPFSPFHPMEISTDRCIFEKIPIDLKFLDNTPPSTLLPSDDDTCAAVCAKKDVIDTIDVQTLNAPAFIQIPIDHVVPKEKTTTLSDSATMVDFNTHPSKTISNVINRSLKMLKEVRTEIQEFEDTIKDTIRMIKLLYLG
nr:MAG: protein m48 [Herpesviridae sp.]